MIDGIIKQTGNSRYLKSAITEATTWEQFRAALIAGTLPIDLNGINAAGWQTLATALSKANLLSDSVAAAIKTLAGLSANPDTPNAALSAIATAVAAGAKIATGSYVGTGTYGSANPCSLTFDFVPKIIFLARITDLYYLSPASVNGWGSEYRILMAGSNRIATYYGNFQQYASYTFANNQATWFAKYNAEEQMNTSGSTYIYVAIG